MKTLPKTLLLFILCLTSSCFKSYKLCGKVVDKFRTDAGYKEDPQAHVVFYSDSLKRNVDVLVTWNLYVNAEPGDKVCFLLNDYQLAR